MNLFNTTHFEPNTKKIDKSSVKDLLAFATSDREREIIRYTVYTASGFTATQDRRMYGFENMDKRADKVQKALDETCEIKEAINDIAKTPKVLLDANGAMSDVEDSCSSV